MFGPGCLTNVGIEMGFFFWTSVIMVLLLLWNFNSVARYYLKFSLFVFLSLVFATVPIPLMLYRPKDSRNALISARALRMSAWLMGLKYRIQGKENIVEDSGCVVLINHQSALDLIVLAELWPVMDNCTVISKKEIFYLWPFGLASWLWGTIFIDRLNAEKAQDSVNSTGKTIKDRKARVLMFPEGTRNMQDTLLPYKKGAFHLAVASQCPIQPVVVDRYTFLGKNRFDKGEVTISILPAIPTEGKTRDDIPILMDISYSTMSAFFAERCRIQNKKAN